MKREKEPEKNQLEKLQEIIDKAETEIDAEFERTDNSWMNCFGSMVFALELYSNDKELEELLTPEKYQEVLSRIGKLKKRSQELRTKYPNKETMPPEKIRQELMSELDVFKESD